MRSISSGVKCSPAVGAAAEPGVAGVYRLVALRFNQPLLDIGRQRHLPDVLEQLLRVSTLVMFFTSQRPPPRFSSENEAPASGGSSSAHRPPGAAPMVSPALPRAGAGGAARNSSSTLPPVGLKA